MDRWILQDRNVSIFFVSIVQRFRYFESVVSSVACFAGGHRTMHNRHLERLNTHFRKLCGSIVGPPPGTYWTLEWHEILHQWNVQVNIFIDRANIKIRSHIFLSERLEVSATYCHTTARALGSTNFTMVLGWNKSNWSPTFSLGVKTLMLLQVQRLGAMDSRCYESQPLRSTLRIFRRILLYIQLLDSILCRIILRQWRAGMT